MVKIGGSKQKGTRKETLDPTAQRGLDFLIQQAQGLGGAALVPELAPETLSGISGLTEGLGGLDPLALEAIQTGATREVAPGGREALDRATQFAAERAQTQVSDVFTAGGRTGSPAQATAVARGVSQAVSPFAFQFEREELRRQDAAQAQRTAAAFGLQQVRSGEDLAELNRRLTQLQAQGLIDDQARRKLEEPFRRLGLIAPVIASAAGLAPSDVRTTGSQTGFGLNIAAPKVPGT